MVAGRVMENELNGDNRPYVTYSIPRKAQPGRISRSMEAVPQITNKK